MCELKQFVSNNRTTHMTNHTSNYFCRNPTRSQGNTSNSCYSLDNCLCMNYRTGIN